MRIKRSKKFKKHFIKRIKPNTRLVEKYERRMYLFLQNSNDPILRDHSLSGKYNGCRAFRITGDVRVIYYIDSEFLYLDDIGTHAQVYRM